MRRDIVKYFWGFNKKALRQTEKILKDPQQKKFLEYIVTLLSRCDNPSELFSIIDKQEFIKQWPRIKNYWRRMAKDSDFRNWWQTIYEELLRDYKVRQARIEKPSVIFLKIGSTFKNERIRKGWTQNELALRLGMKQPDVSKIEEGKKNITLGTLSSLCKILGIKKIEL